MYRLWPCTVDATNTWSATSVEVHARKRRVLSHALSEKALRGAEPFIHGNVDRWLTLLCEHKQSDNQWTEPINMADQVAYLVMDILGDLSFGKCFDMKEAGSNLRHIVDLMVGFITLMNPVSHRKAFS
jgi:cytochrome P450